MIDKITALVKDLIEKPETTFIGLVIAIPLCLIFFYEKIKNIGFIQDLATLKSRSFKIRVKNLIDRKDSDLYLPYEKKIIEYEIKTLEYQNLLKTNETNLQLLIFLNGFQNKKFALDYYHNCHSFLKFNDSTNKLELKDPINISHAKLLRRIGGIIFTIISLFSYLLMVWFLYLHEEFDVGKSYIGFWALFQFLLMIFIIFIGLKIMRCMSKRAEAIDLLDMKRINIIYGSNIER